MADDYGDVDDLDDLYQQVIVDHSRSPRNCRTLTDSTGTAMGHNPLCGDSVTVFVKVDNGIVSDISFVGKGCAICTASASLMTESLKGKSTEEAERLFGGFHGMLTGDNGGSAEALDKLVVFAGVNRFPIRVKCATLPWHTMKAALTEGGRAVTTE